MDIYQAIAILVSTWAIFIPFFLWVRSESRADFRLIVDLHREIHEEIKDFHGRLCAIEEKNKKS